MNRVTMFLAIVVAFFESHTELATAQPSKPNVIVIEVNNTGWIGLGSYGVLI